MRVYTQMRARTHALARTQGTTLLLHAAACNLGHALEATAKVRSARLPPPLMSLLLPLKPFATAVNAAAAAINAVAAAVNSVAAAISKQHCLECVRACYALVCARMCVRVRVCVRIWV
jgi:hypothetical protein